MELTAYNHGNRLDAYRENALLQANNSEWFSSAKTLRPIPAGMAGHIDIG